MSDGHSAAQDFQIRKERESQVCGRGAHTVTHGPGPGAQPQAAVGSALWAGPEPGKGGFQNLGLKMCYSYYIQLRMGCVPGEPHGRGVLSSKY